MMNIIFDIEGRLTATINLMSGELNFKIPI